jgi:hypothetical protein
MLTKSALEGAQATLIDAKCSHLRAYMHTSTMRKLISVQKQVA